MCIWPNPLNMLTLTSQQWNKRTSAMEVALDGTGIIAVLVRTVVWPETTSLLENNDKCNFNWSLWGTPHTGQAKLLDCNEFQGNVAGQNYRCFPVMNT